MLIRSIEERRSISGGKAALQISRFSDVTREVRKMVLKKLRLELTLEQDFVFPPENDLPKCLVTSPKEYSAQQLIGHIWPGKKRWFLSTTTRGSLIQGAPLTSSKNKGT